MIVKLTNGKTLDDKHNPNILAIFIVAPGIIVKTKNIDNEVVYKNSTREFYPWHRIELVVGQYYKDDPEHELEQFQYLGLSE